MEDTIKAGATVTKKNYIYHEEINGYHSLKFTKVT
jgi:hypothetical protein